MKANKLKLLSIAICCFVVSLSEAQCAQKVEKNDEPVRNNHLTYQNMKSLLEEHLRVNTSLLHSSKDKDIVAVLGATGSGKSTLINYLMGLELKANDNEEIELIDASNPLAMKIGDGGDSETLLPRCAPIGSLVFYDFPGFRDTRGTGINILTSSFIKHIIENARSTRLVFVAGQDEITAARGESFENLVKITNKLFPQIDTIQSSLVVITKSIKDTVETLIEYIEKKVSVSGKEKLARWIDTKHIVPMPKKNFGVAQKDIIINEINNTSPSRINHVEIGAIYSENVNNDLKDIFSSEMSNLMGNALDLAPKDHATISSINLAKIYFSGNFEADILQRINISPLTILLKPLSETIFESEKKEILLRIKQSRDLNITQLEVKKAQLEKLEQEEKARQAEIQRQKELQSLTAQINNLQLSYSSSANYPSSDSYVSFVTQNNYAPPPSTSSVTNASPTSSSQRTSGGQFATGNTMYQSQTRSSNGQFGSTISSTPSVTNASPTSSSQRTSGGQFATGNTMYQSQTRSSNGQFGSKKN